MRYKPHKLITALALGLLVGGNITVAQVIQDPTELSVILLPKNPTSFANTTIRLENFAINLDAADIEWFVNGKSVTRGIGKKEFTVRTGAVGIATTVRVLVRAQEGGTIEKIITLNPSDIDLLWQADTYTPVFYKGKALSASESLVTILANPTIKSRGVSLSPKNLLYRWKVDEKAILTQSGFGKNTLVFQKELLREESIVEVEISTSDGAISTQKSLVLRDFNPEIHFYDEDPLQGTNYSRSLENNVQLTSSEGTVRAEPYFISGKSYNDKSFERIWKINNRPVLTDSKRPLLLTVRNERNTNGTAQISLSLAHTTKLLQNAQKSFSVTLDR